MRKITVLSFFQSCNIGDVLIANQIKNLLSGYSFECSYFDITSGKPYYNCALTKSVSNKGFSGFKKKIIKLYILGDLICSFLNFKSTRYKKICSAARDSEIIVFAGGNQIMELNMLPTGIIQMYRAVKTFKKNGKKVYFCFSGIGPFKSRLSVKYARKILKLADFVSVRDDYSLNWVKKLSPEKNAEIWCDPVLMLDSKPQNQGFKNAVGINSYFGHDTRCRKKMCDSYIELIRKLRQNDKDLKVYLFSSELTDIADIELIKKSFLDDEKVIAEKISSKEELFEFYNKIDAVVAARMHTAITCAVCHLPMITVSWQGKVSSFMQLMEIPEFNFTVSEFVSDTDLVLNKLLYIIENSKAIIDKNEQRIKFLSQNTITKLDIFSKGLEE